MAGKRNKFLGPVCVYQVMYRRVDVTGWEVEEQGGWEAQLGERKLVTGCAELRAKWNWFTELYCEGGTGPCHCMHIYILYFIF